MVGANPSPGAFSPAHESFPGFWIDGGNYIELGSVKMRNSRGDCVYISGSRAGVWANGIWIHDSACSGPSRHGVGIVAGRNIVVERTAFSNIGYHALVIEPNNTDPVQGASHVTIRYNVIRAPVFAYIFAADGWGPVDHLTVTRNRVYGVELRTTVRPLDGSGYRRAAIAVTYNSSDRRARGPVMFFDRNDGLSVVGNSQPLSAGTLLAVWNSTKVRVSGNRN